jgi:hypothetical protein
VEGILCNRHGGDEESTQNSSIKTIREGTDGSIVFEWIF